MLERSIAFGLVVGLLLVYAGWANEDEKPPVAPRPAEGLPPEMPEEDEEEREPDRPSDKKRPSRLVGGLLGDDD